MTEMQDPLAQPGYEAYYEGYARDENPEHDGTDGHEAWDKGWVTAKVEFELKIGEDYEPKEKHEKRTVRNPVASLHEAVRQAEGQDPGRLR